MTFNILRGRSQEGAFTIFTLCLPRMITGLLCGFACGLSGNTFQRIFNNPLASPDILGVSSASALAQQTDILLLDEPTTYLDISYQIEILDLLTTLNREKKTTILMVLHDINLCARYADYLFAVKKGRLVAEGVPGEIITPFLVESVFGLTSHVIEDPVSKTPLILPMGKYHRFSQEKGPENSQ